jgi:trehalose synthase
VVLDNAVRAALDYDVVIVHDPQPLPLIEMRQRQAWIWCCHVDLSAPDPDIWDYVAPIANLYDAAVFSLPEYAQELSIPQHFIKPAIDPFSPINQGLSRAQMIERLRQYHIPVDLPLVIQAGRFDKWKDPQGGVDAFCTASEQVAATLVLVGNTATDDPEGPAMFEAICASSGERIIVLSVDDPLLVNALQRRAAVVLQKSLREGFGLTVSEAMLKGKPVIGGNVGGIRHQIKEAQTGFLVDDVPQAAVRIQELLSDAPLRRNNGTARERTSSQSFLDDTLDGRLARSDRGVDAARPHACSTPATD